MLSKVQMSTGEKVQFKMMLPTELVERLTLLAQKNGKRSGQEVVEELINFYLPVWITVTGSLERAMHAQINKAAESFIDVPNKGKLDDDSNNKKSNEAA